MRDERVADGIDEPDASGPRALAQYALRYIVAQDEEGLLVIDQHTAHERVVYEALADEADSGPLPRQALLFPRPVELSPRQLELAERHRQDLERLGFRTEAYGGGAMMVREVPAIYGREATADSFEDLLAELDRGDIPEATTIGHRILATIACHTSVRKGVELTRDKMNHILGRLAACRNRSHCPHGRVISLRVGLEPLDRQFGRE